VHVLCERVSARHASLSRQITSSRCSAGDAHLSVAHDKQEHLLWSQSITTRADRRVHLTRCAFPTIILKLSRLGSTIGIRGGASYVFVPRKL